MSAERDELRRLVQELPEELVPRALVDGRRYVRPGLERQWPPAWFGSIAGDGTRVGARTEEILREGFRPVD